MPCTLLFPVANRNTDSKKKKKKKKYSPKKILIFQEMELSNSKTKKFLIFLQKKAVLIFQENTEKVLYISGSNFPNLKK